MRRRSLLGAAMAIGPGRSAFAQSGGRRRRLAIVSAAESVAIMVEKGDNRHYRTLFEEHRLRWNFRRRRDDDMPGGA